MMRDDLGNRMKQYEQVSKTKLIRRMPVVIRIDGKAFHTFTRGFRKPFDELLMETMQETTKYLCEHIQGCVLGYTQSDEITLILVDYKKLDSSSWFDSEVQKMCSISASMATMAFNRIFGNKVQMYFEDTHDVFDVNYSATLYNALGKGAMFDARCFNIPKEEVTNCVYWRQLDASRNSIQMLAQANFSHKELQNKSCNDIQDMLVIQKNINWNNLEIDKKRGSCVVRNLVEFEEGTAISKLRDTSVNESSWVVDKDIPVFKGDGRDYIERLINVEE